MAKLKAFLLILLLAALSQPARGQRLVSKLSVQEIAINSTFTGGSLTLFGNVETLIGEDTAVDGPFDIIIMIEGTAVDKVVREKSRQVGIWLNAQQVTFSGVPSFFHILSTQPLENIQPPGELRELGISLRTQIQHIEAETPQVENRFTNELIRLMNEDETYGVSPHSISFHSETFYSAHIELPSDVPNGTYLATTFLFKDGALIDRGAERFFVRTVGMEKFISTSARDFPLAYGIACVLLAVFTGWLGGVAFKR